MASAMRPPGVLNLTNSNYLFFDPLEIFKLDVLLLFITVTLAPENVKKPKKSFDSSL